MSAKTFSRLTKLTQIKFLFSALMKGTPNLVSSTNSFISLYNATYQTFILPQPNTTWKYAVFTANANLVKELEDDSRFDKYIFNSFELLLGDSLFRSDCCPIAVFPIFRVKSELFTGFLSRVL